ncbi:Spo0B domain-containing protein [Halobacillus sp. Marseille-Q1614]|uniref:Spo0B domain-containing protein n=1 Tax=Halobacillus sp. Marseille-Q1614 TaxID=2709134 RepID=UPI00156ECED5|nr:Spo0B domain-containing protein [Halobacillus sp. Marseille-Q1614]
MENQEVVHLLRHKRHDWMNQMQLIQGYVAMGKMDRLQHQVNQVITEAEEERKLLNTSAYEFSLWLLTFNWEYERFRITYWVNTEVDLSRHDRKLLACAQRMLAILDEHSHSEELYEGTLEIHQGNASEQVKLSWNWSGAFSDNVIAELKKESFLTAHEPGYELSIEMMIE